MTDDTDERGEEYVARQRGGDSVEFAAGWEAAASASSAEVMAEVRAVVLDPALWGGRPPLVLITALDALAEAYR
jgi:hypothetical protein